MSNNLKKNAVDNLNVILDKYLKRKSVFLKNKHGVVMNFVLNKAELDLIKQYFKDNVFVNTD